MPDMTMQERVARDICLAHGVHHPDHMGCWGASNVMLPAWTQFIHFARAAIEAMRELNDEEIIIACDASDLFTQDYVQAHQAMIDAALKETP